MRTLSSIIFAVALLAVVALAVAPLAVRAASRPGRARPPAHSPEDVSMEKATFAGGCFWCMQPPFEKLRGVTQVMSGYTGGPG